METYFQVEKEKLLGENLPLLSCLESRSFYFISPSLLIEVSVVLDFMDRMW
jgi:hypothetical protein